MAQLKDSLITGDLRVTGKIYGLLDSNGAPINPKGIPYIVGPSTDTAGVWTGTCNEITAYEEGMTIIYVPGVAGASSSVTLNINGLGAKAVSINGPAGAGYTIGTYYPSGTPIMLTYMSEGGWRTAEPNILGQVQQNAALTTSGNYPVLLGINTNTTAQLGPVNKTSTFVYNPNTSELTTNGTITFGNGTTAILNAKTPSRSSAFIIVGGSKKSAGNADGTAVRLGAGGLTLVGGGEYASNRYNVGDLADSTEDLYLGADSNVYIETNAQTTTARKTFTFETDGKLTATSFAGNGSALTNLNGSNIASGTVAAARLPAASTSAAGIIQIGTGASNAAAGNHNHDTTYVNVTGDSMSGRLTMTSGKPINQILTGSGTAGSTGTEETPVHNPAKWTFNTGLTATNGDIFTIKIPVAGHDNGVYMSINNGTNYYPVVLHSTTRHTTHFPVNTYITVIFESTGSAASIYPVNGGTSTGTVSGGVFRVLNYRDTNDNTLVRTYKAYATNVELPLIGGSTGSTTPAAPTGETSYANLYGQIPKTTANRATYNLSTGKITVPGGVVANLTGAASKITDLTSTDQASSSDVARRVWFAYSNNTTGRPAYSDNFTYVTSNNCLHVQRIALHIPGTTKGTNPSSATGVTLNFQDSAAGIDAKHRVGMVNCYINTSGSTVHNLVAYDWTADNDSRYTNLQIVHEKGADAGYVQISGQPKTAGVLRNISYSTGVPASSDGKLGQVHIQYTTNSKPEIFPIGAIYLSVDSTNPSSYFAGTWEQIAAGRALFGAGTLGGITYTAGNTVDAGLPNVTGKVVRALSDYNYNNTDYNQYTTGPFYIDGGIYATSSSLGDGTQDGVRNVAMDLSRANSIYGNSSTVQPPAFVVYVWKRTA